MREFEYYGCNLQVPDWANWIAMDSDGSVWVYQQKPETRGGGYWWGGSGSEREATRLHVKELNVGLEWHQTLQYITHTDKPVVGKLAPHVSNEVRLVLAGNKPLASIEKFKDQYGYALAISLANTGALVYKVVAQNEVVITLPHNKHLIQEWEALLCHGVKLYGLHGFHYRMGKLYGYTDADIELFIKSDVQCDCNKCRGNPDGDG